MTSADSFIGPSGVAACAECEGLRGQRLVTCEAGEAAVRAPSKIRWVAAVPVRTRWQRPMGPHSTCLAGHGLLNNLSRVASWGRWGMGTPGPAASRGRAILALPQVALGGGQQRRRHSSHHVVGRCGRANNSARSIVSRVM